MAAKVRIKSLFIQASITRQHGRATCASQPPQESKARYRPYRLILLDHHMPELDGIEVIRQIRAQPELNAARIMMVSPGS
jgi:CheY-like chemotaxis protein